MVITTDEEAEAYLELTFFRGKIIFRLTAFILFRKVYNVFLILKFKEIIRWKLNVPVPYTFTEVIEGTEQRSTIVIAVYDDDVMGSPELSNMAK